MKRHMTRQHATPIQHDLFSIMSIWLSKRMWVGGMRGRGVYWEVYWEVYWRRLLGRFIEEVYLGGFLGRLIGVVYGGGVIGEV